MAIRFQTECLTDFLQDAMPLLHRHWGEVGACPQSHALQVNEPMYAAIESVDALHITTARHTSGGLVGYAIYFVQDYPHVQGLRMAQSDALYLAPACRQGFTGVRLLQAAECALVAKGVKNIMQTCTVKKDFGVILRRMGYTNTETVYRKEV